MIDERDAARILTEALARGGDWAELFWERATTLACVVDDAKLEDAVAGLSQGAGVRVMSGERTAYANGDATDVSDLEAIAARAAASVVPAGAPGRCAPLSRLAIPSPSTVRVDPRDVPLERKVALVRLADRTARAMSPQVTQVTAAYREYVQDVLVASSDGRFRTDRRVRLVFAVNAVAREGEVLESGYEAIAGTAGFELLDEDAVREVARTAAERAVRNVRAEPCPAGTFTVVLSSEAGGTLIHESVGHGLEADLNLRGLSVYAGRIGERVASELITVVDDGTDPGKRGTEAIDDEGTPAHRTVLIEKGVLKTYLTDRTHARKLGLAESGNGRRESFRHLPICRMTNTMIAPGTSDPSSILASVADGIFVKKMGGGQVDVVSGSFAFEITECYRITGGRIGEPLRGATLVGEGPTLMKEIDLVGSDLGYSVGTCGKDGQGAPVADAQPTLRIPRVVVGGKVRAA